MKGRVTRSEALVGTSPPEVEPMEEKKDIARGREIDIQYRQPSRLCRSEWESLLYLCENLQKECSCLLLTGAGRPEVYRAFQVAGFGQKREEENKRKRRAGYIRLVDVRKDLTCSQHQVRLQDI